MSKFDIATTMNGIMNSQSYKAVFAKPQPQFTKTAAKKKDEDAEDKKKGKKDEKKDVKKDKKKKAKAMNKFQACVIGLAKISETLDKESDPRLEKAASLVFEALDALVKGAMPTGELSDCGLASDKKDKKKDDKDDDDKDKSKKKDDDDEDEEDEEDEEDDDAEEDSADAKDILKGDCEPHDPMCGTLNADDGEDEDDVSDWYNSLMDKVIDPSHPHHDAVTDTLGGGGEEPSFDEEDIESLLSALDEEEELPSEFSFVSLKDPEDTRSKMDEDIIEYKSLAGRKLTSIQKLALELKKAKRPLV